MGVTKAEVIRSRDIGSTRILTIVCPICEARSDKRTEHQGHGLPHDQGLPAWRHLHGSPVLLVAGPELTL